MTTGRGANPCKKGDGIQSAEGTTEAVCRPFGTNVAAILSRGLHPCLWSVRPFRALRLHDSITCESCVNNWNNLLHDDLLAVADVETLLGLLHALTTEGVGGLRVEV